MALACALYLVLVFAPQQNFLADGLKALDASQPAVAEPLLRQAVAADPNDASAHFNLALALSLERKDTEAIAEYRRTLEFKPGLYQADLNLGTLLLRNQRPAEALPVLKEAADSPKNDASASQNPARANLLYGQALLDTGDTARAEERFRVAAALDPKSAAAEAGLAHSLLKQSKLTQAADHFRRAGSLDAQYREGLLELAGAFEQAGMLPDAIAVYRQFPDNAPVQEHLAHLLVDNGNAAAAIPNLERTVKANPTVANRLALADAYKLNKQPGKMIEQLQLAVAGEPSNYDLRMDLGRELRDARRPVEAAQQFSAAAALLPNSVKAWNELATIYVVNGDYPDGLAALDHVRALGKESAGDYYFRAICLERLRKLKPAMEAYHQFLAADENKMPDQEFLARQRIRIIDSELHPR